MKHHEGFLVRNQALVQADVVDHGAVRLHNVGPAVVIVVNELCGYTAKQNRLVADSRAIGVVRKGAVCVVMVERFNSISR